MLLRSIVLMVVLALFCAPAAFAGAVEDLLAHYRNQGARAFSPGAGASLWEQSFRDPKSGEERNCTTCHGRDLRSPAKHATTGKPIDPMASSVNPKRLTDAGFIEKWFTRNCKWALGRSCTPQEKGDVLVYLQTQ